MCVGMASAQGFGDRSTPRTSVPSAIRRNARLVPIRPLEPVMITLMKRASRPALWWAIGQMTSRDLRCAGLTVPIVIDARHRT